MCVAERSVPSAVDQRGGSDDEAVLRTRWRELVHVRLPAAAPGRCWPIHLDHCFARVMLDNACDRPWRESISPPAWRHAPASILAQAIELGEAVLDDRADLHALNRRSLRLRGK